ncbi:MAG: hypothetical protein ACOCRX_04865 [Candidatus Woesearchaeota archaeon]
MFFIINISNQKIFLNDINIKLKKNQAIDLDEFISRDKSERSVDLKNALSKGSIQIKVKDQYNSNTNDDNNYEDDNLNGNVDAENLKKDIIDNVKTELEGFAETLAEKINNKNDDKMNKIQEIIKETVVNMPNSSNEQIVSNVKANIKDNEEIELNEDVLSSINAKTINNMVKDTRNSRLKKDKKQYNDSIKDNVSELENLI